MQQLDFPADDAALVAAVNCANLPTLMMVIVHLTGNSELLRNEPRPMRASIQQLDGGMGEAQSQRIRELALRVLREFRAGDRTLPALPSVEVFQEMMSFSLGQEIAPEYVPMMLQDMMLQDAPRSHSHARRTAQPRDFHVLVIGAGLSGIVAAIKLKQAGIRYTLVEKNADVGGTWLENSYPGCRVDLPNHFYSFSFEPNYDWSEHYSPRDELLAYFQRVASKYGVRQTARFETEVLSASYDASQRDTPWSVTLRDRSGQQDHLQVSAIITAVGQLNRPQIPALPGLDSFAGPSFHTAAWRHGVDLAGKRVAVIGTGASGMQVVPQLAPIVQQLLICQRSPQWSVSNPDYRRQVSDAEKWLLRHVPFYAPWYRFRLFFTNADGVHAGLKIDPNWPHPRRAINADNDRIREKLTRYIHEQVGEHTHLLDRVVPDYPPFAKRLLLDNQWFETLKRDNVELITDRIAAVTPEGIRMADGSEHALDAIVFATGFQANRFLAPMHIQGRNQSLHELWGDNPRAHLGMTVPGFPNLFCLYGPNTNLAHGGSIIFHSECQVHYIIECLRMLIDGDYAEMECKQAVHDAYNARVDAAHECMVWSHPHVSNWYKNKAGRVTTNSPFRLVDYWSMTRLPSADDFAFKPREG